MNILYFIRNFPKLSESFVLNEIYGLDQLGHNVMVVAQQRPTENIEHDEHESLDVPVYYSKEPSVRDVPDLVSPTILNQPVLRRAAYRATLKHHVKSFILARECIEFIERTGRHIDHVHSHFANPNKLPASYVAAYYGTSCTITAHAVEMFSDPDSRMLSTIFDRFERVIVPSRYNRSYLREQFGIETPIDVVPATTRVDKFSPTTTEVPTRLLTVARLVEKKGVVYAIEAIAALAETHPDIEYHIVGTGEREAMLRRRAADLGVADQVRFLGHVSDERLRRELDEAAAFVLPCVVAADGDRDSSPVAIKEAMAMRTPCISTTVTGIPEMIENGVNGRLVEPRNVDALAAAIQTTLGDDADRGRMGRNARETIRTEFSLDVAMEKLVSSFRKSRTQV